MKNGWANINPETFPREYSLEPGTVPVEEARLTHYFKSAHHAGMRCMKSLCEIIVLAKELDFELTLFDNKCEKCQARLKKLGSGGDRDEK